MRVAHICTLTGDAAGAARASYRIHRALREQGIQSSVLAMFSNTDDADVHEIGRSGIRERLRRETGRYFERLVSRYANPQPGNGWTSGLVSLLQVDEHPDIAAADAIMLYWVGGFLSISQIDRLLRLGKPIVWRLSDMWAFTGGCHYSMGCDRYRDRCGVCPQLPSSSQLDLSRLVWTRKRSSWQTDNLTVVCPSTWMARCARQSSLLAGTDVRVIHTGVDLTLYRPVDRGMARELLGLPNDKKILLAGASGLSLTGGRKGEEYLFDAFARVRQSIPAVHLALFGTSRAPEGIPCTALGIIQDERLLALAYSAADLFISTSLEDNLPNTVLEALACGLPVVGFAIDGILDAVEHGQTGLLSAPRDAASLASQIANGLLDGDGRQRMAHQARQTALTRFDATRQGADYASLLQDLCAARAVRSAAIPSNKNHLDSPGSYVSPLGTRDT